MNVKTLVLGIVMGGMISFGTYFFPTTTVSIPFSPVTCAITASVVLILTFHLGRWCGIQHILNRIRKELNE